MSQNAAGVSGFFGCLNVIIPLPIVGCIAVRRWLCGRPVCVCVIVVVQ